MKIIEEIVASSKKNKIVNENENEINGVIGGRKA
jgi:hypothetical protein